MSKVVFLSWHYYNSKRQAGFHFLAKSLKKKGFEVVFITSVFNFLSYFKKDKKIYEKDFNRNVIKPKFFDGVKSIVNFHIFSPPIARNSKILEFFAQIFFKLNKASLKEIKKADYIIFESLSSIMFFDRVKANNQNAKIIYRISDDLEVMGASKMIVQYERSVLDQFDLVSVPTKSMYDKFKKLSPENVKLHFHGIDKNLYDSIKTSPYTERINHVFVGNAYLDENFLDTASTIYKDHFFHIIGAFEPKIKKNNVRYYGHMPFGQTVPYVKFATTGLHSISSDSGIASTLSDSLKVLQYSYCKLPIIAPSSIPASHRDNFYHYNYNDEISIKKSIEEALKFDKNNFAVDIKNWDELAFKLIQD